MTDLRRLGASDLKIAPLVLGGNVFGWTADRDASFAVLDAFVEGGGTMIDTADVYSAWVPGHRGGESETMIGEWLRTSGKRDRVQIATKVGMLPGDGGEKRRPHGSPRRATPRSSGSAPTASTCISRIRTMTQPRRRR